MSFPFYAAAPGDTQASPPRWAGGYDCQTPQRQYSMGHKKSSRSVFIKKRNPFHVSQRKRCTNAHVACNGSFPRCVLRCVYLCARNFFPLHVRINGIFILAPFQRYGVSIDRRSVSRAEGGAIRSALVPRPHPLAGKWLC